MSAEETCDELRQKVKANAEVSFEKLFKEHDIPIELKSILHDWYIQGFSDGGLSAMKEFQNLFPFEKELGD